MKISTFNPVIMSTKAEEISSMFEELGFERRHTKTGIKGEDITFVGMGYTGEDGKVFRVDIADAPVPKDVSTIRMNIDNFDEAYNFFIDHGFKNAMGDKLMLSASAKGALLRSPSGFTINIVKHIKE